MGCIKIETNLKMQIVTSQNSLLGKSNTLTLKFKLNVL